METTKADYRQKAYRVYTACLSGMEFVAFHGCRDDEKRNGNVFRVDFCGVYKSACAVDDNLAGTINYGQVYKVIAAVMHGRRYNLLESLCSAMVDALAQAFPDLDSFEISVSKKNPPVDGPCEWSVIKEKWPANE